MAKITFIDHEGTENTIEAENGISVMNAAMDNLVPGIDADCGGECACATCHVFVDEKWLPLCGEASDDENQIIDLNPDRQANSRLCCQIKVSDELDGLTVTTPEFQF